MFLFCIVTFFYFYFIFKYYFKYLNFLKKVYTKNQK